MDAHIQADVLEHWIQVQELKGLSDLTHQKP